MQEGRSFYLNDVRVEIDSIRSPTQVKVRKIGPMDTVMTLSANNRTELIPGVYAQVGLGGTPTMAKIALEAPESVVILRDSLYEKGKD
jgi:hypothetical protein